MFFKKCIGIFSVCLTIYQETIALSCGSALTTELKTYNVKNIGLLTAMLNEITNHPKP